MEYKKGIYHKIVSKFLEAFLEPMHYEIEDIRQQLKDYQEENALLEERCKSLEEKYSLHKDEWEYKIGAMAREIMRTKWKLIDHLEIQDDRKSIECIICGHKDEKKGFQEVITNCIFAGGRLVRYRCPQCGGVFGPFKFREQNKSELDDDYVVHYLGFNENDSTDGEIDTFYLLNPVKEGRYLNYGCGKWAKTIENLRAAGYDVYGYDAYAADVEDKFIITDREVLKKMRFDGIFSHDLLEHLVNPVDELLFMKSLLRSPACKMAHSTACYEYKFEYTRFHTCFYTGNAVEALCKRTNMNVLDYVDDGEAKNFICYVFGILDDELSFMDSMASTGANGEMKIKGGECFYGPYLSCKEGKYRIRLEIAASNEDEFDLKVTAKRGEIVVKTGKLRPGINIFDFDLSQNYTELEFVITASEEQLLELKTAGFII